MEEAKRDVLWRLREDAEACGSRLEDRINTLIDSLPSHLKSKSRRFRITAVRENARTREFDEALMWIYDAGIVNPSVNASDPDQGWLMSSVRDSQKLYVADTGLLVTMCMDEEGLLPRMLILGDVGVDEGMFAENAVAQCLRANGHLLHFYSRSAGERDDGTSWNSYIGIDFLIRRNGKVCSVDVKTSERLRHDSLDRFTERFDRASGQPYVLCTRNVETKAGVVFLPLYMASVL